MEIDTQIYSVDYGTWHLSSSVALNWAEYLLKLEEMVRMSSFTDGTRKWEPESRRGNGCTLNSLRSESFVTIGTCSRRFVSALSKK